MAVSDKGMLVCVRHFNYQDLAEADMSLTTIQVLTREIEMTLRAIFGSHTNTKLSFMVSANSELFDDLSARLSEAMDCEIAALDPFEEIAGAKQNGLNADSVVAAGLALVGADRVPGALDFLAVDEPGSDRTVEIRRGLFIAATLVLLIGASLVFRLFYQLHNLEKQHELVKKEIREVFVQTLPEETKIVNEAAQMNEKFNAIQAEYDALAAGFSNRVMPLKILQVISEKIPADQDIRINDMSMSPGSVRLTGIAPSFASMDNLITAFRRVSAFKSIEVLNTDVDARSNGVRFTFSILLK
jgi:Tfp pilus assembly protein PilN